MAITLYPSHIPGWFTTEPLGRQQNQNAMLQQIGQQNIYFETYSVPNACDICGANYLENFFDPTCDNCVVWIMYCYEHKFGDPEKAKGLYPYGYLTKNMLQPPNYPPPGAGFGGYGGITYGGASITTSPGIISTTSTSPTFTFTTTSSTSGTISFRSSGDPNSSGGSG